MIHLERSLNKFGCQRRVPSLVKALVTEQIDLSPSLRALENQQSNADFDPVIAGPSCFGDQEERKAAVVDDIVEDDLLSSSTSSTTILDSMDCWEEDEVVSLFEEEEEGLLIESLQEKELENKVQVVNPEEEFLGITSLFEEDNDLGGKPLALCASTGNFEVGLIFINAAENHILDLPLIRSGSASLTSLSLLSSLSLLLCHFHILC